MYELKAYYAKNQTVRLVHCMQYDTGICVKFCPPVPFPCQLDAGCEGDSPIGHCEEISPGLFRIDDSFLADGRNIILYLYLTGENYGRTIQKLIIPVIRRPKRGSLAQ